MGHLLSKLSAFGLAVGFSPLHIALLLLLLLAGHERVLPLLQSGKLWLFNTSSDCSTTVICCWPW